MIKEISKLSFDYANEKLSSLFEKYFFSALIICGVIIGTILIEPDTDLFGIIFGTIFLVIAAIYFIAICIWLFVYGINFLFSFIVWFLFFKDRQM